MFNRLAPGRRNAKKCLAATYLGEPARIVASVSVCVPTALPSVNCQYAQPLCWPVVNAWCSLSAMLNAPALGNPVAGESHAVFSPLVSVIQDFLP